MKECERHEELFSSLPLQCFSVICDWQKAHSMKIIDFNSLFVFLYPHFFDKVTLLGKMSYDFWLDMIIFNIFVR